MTLGIVMLLGGMTISSPQAQNAYSTKVLLHGTKPVADSSNWGIGGWLVVPNPGAQVFVTVVGPRYEVAKKWSVEVMAGTFSLEQEGQFLIDIRASYDAFDPIHFWTNVEYFPKTGDWYTYLEANYRIGQLGLIGVETENSHFSSGSDDLSFGPRVVIPFRQGQFILIGAYQFHFQASYQNQAWSRVVLNF